MYQCKKLLRYAIYPGTFSKIYTWPVHRKEAVRKYIEEDKVDAIIVGLNNMLTTPVTTAFEMISANEEINPAGRNTAVFSGHKISPKMETTN